MRPAAMSGPGDLSIRLARPEERDELEELQRRASLALAEYRDDLEAHADAIHLPQEQLDRGAVFVAELEGRPVGFAALDGPELDGLFVEPGLWRRGIGRMLVEAATHEARRRGLSLTVLGNPSARKFYERCGFVAEGTEQTRFGSGLRMSR
ncbi:MAG TPA: GNAT family N-acetyltransferase [Sphingomicrobium sp.]|nr:GNAT family N-acetyltransferase [Sphingomicrobium sp.]